VVFIILLVSGRSLMGRRVSGRLVQGVQWATVIVLGAINVAFLVMPAAGVGE